MPKNKALFPGTFDPFTIGHLEVVKKALKDFGEIHIIIMKNEEKTPYFNLEAKIDIINTLKLDNVIIGHWNQYASDYCKKHNIQTIIRGYRNSEDLAYEKDLAKQYKECWDRLNVKFYQTNLDVSSTQVKQLIKDNKEYLHLVPKGANYEW